MCIRDRVMSEVMVRVGEDVAVRQYDAAFDTAGAAGGYFDVNDLAIFACDSVVEGCLLYTSRCV